MHKATSLEDLQAEIEELHIRLQDAEETLRAIGGAEVDAFLVNREERKRVVLLQYADMPYRILLERMNEGAITVNSDGIILYSNGFLARMLKLGSERAVGESLYDFVQLAEELKLRALLEEARQGSSRGEIVLTARDGTNYLLQLSIAPFQEELPDAFCVIASDLAERKRKEEQLQMTTEQLRALGARLESIREEERQRIATEVHDKLGQALTVLKMNLSSLEKNMDANDRLNRIRSTKELVDATMESVQQISKELRPRAMELGLEAALECYCQQFEEMSGIECSLMSNIDRNYLDREVNIALYRIAQEALTNVARHADAAKVRIELFNDDESIVLEIVDNGRGASEEEIGSRDALGILGMRERAFVFDGDVSISGERGAGTRVTIRIPFQKD